MASYSIFFKRTSEKELRAIPKPYLSKIIEKIKTLSDHPRPAGAQMLKGEGKYYRLRQGDYRIIYEIDDGNQKIWMIRIGHRREVYG